LLVNDNIKLALVKKCDRTSTFVISLWKKAFDKIPRIGP